jgi:hypothetical protein
MWIFYTVWNVLTEWWNSKKAEAPAADKELAKGVHAKTEEDQPLIKPAEESSEAKKVR